MKQISTAAGCLVLAWLAFAQPALAQNSRQEELALKRAEKAKRLEPEVQTRAEHIARRVEQFGQIRNGWFVMSPSLGSGSGLGFGVGYRQFLGERALVQTGGGWSVYNARFFESSITFPPLGDGLVNVRGTARYQDVKRIKYYGIGRDTPPEAKTTFGLASSEVGVDVTVRPIRWFSIGSTVGYTRFDTHSGSVAPSIEAVFTQATAPGLFFDPSYLIGTVFAAIDTRESPGYTRRGGLYLAEYRRFEDLDDRFSFGRLDLDVRQYVPLLRGNWVLALRGLVMMTERAAGQQIPYFLLPTVGGTHSVRGFDSLRFRDRHGLLLSGEFRWLPSRALDMAIFYDAGKVASRRGDLDFDGLHTSYGIGARIHSPLATALRMEIARSREKVRFMMGFGPVW
jgi:hypothetical protein